MFRLLLWGFLIWWVAKHALPALKRPDDRKSPGVRDDEPLAGGEGDVQDMVRCAQCGVYVPRSEAVEGGGQFYCGEDHRRQGVR